MRQIKASLRLGEHARQLPVRWATVAFFAVVLAYADGFWLTSLQGAIGAIERLESPLNRWLRDSTIMLPLLMLAVLGALFITHRWFGKRHALVRFAATVLISACISGGVGIVEVAVSSVYDYSYQTHHLELLHSFGVIAQPGAVDLIGFGADAPLPYALYCNLRGTAIGSATSLMEYATFMVHVRAVSYAGILLLITNLILMAGLLALRKDALWSAAMLTSPSTAEAKLASLGGAAL